MIGVGYVGLVSAACFSEFGWKVACTDKDADWIEQLRRGSVPIYEPRLEELLERNLRNGRISFSTELAPAACW
jgi:UDPglucose 6-dehydrogenase